MNNSNNLVIDMVKISIGELTKGYKNLEDEGVFGFSGKLNIRPSYQREFIYNSEQRESVINSIMKTHPINTFYWSENNSKDTDFEFELIDGQQRTLSICQYVDGKFPWEGKYFSNLTKEEQSKLLDYSLIIFMCKGDEREKLDWFMTINIASERLTKQELLNAAYTGTWLSDAKKYFSKRDCLAYDFAKDFISGEAIRQDYLRAAIGWISNDNIEDYMAKHQHDDNASELWAYFQRVINWAIAIFPVYRKEMKGINWGELYNKYRNDNINPTNAEKEIKELMMDDDVTNKKGIYKYILSRDLKHLNIRLFTGQMKREVYERQEGICVSCKNHFSLNEMEADHITPWIEGGKTNEDNCQMLCVTCNRRKSSK